MIKKEWKKSPQWRQLKECLIKNLDKHYTDQEHVTAYYEVELV